MVTISMSLDFMGIGKMVFLCQKKMCFTFVVLRFQERICI